MSKRGDNIHKRRDGRWEGRYIQSRDANGKAIYKSVYGKSYTEAKNKLIFIMKGESNMNSMKGSIAFSIVLDEWLSVVQIKVKASTYSKYVYMIESHIKPELGSLPIRNISITILNNFIVEKLKNGRLDGDGGLSSSYVKTLALILNSVMDFAAESQYCDRLESKVIKPAVEKSNPVVLDEEEYFRLEQFVTNDIDCTKLGILISLFAGLRIGEICALRWSDIDFKNGCIHVNSTVARVKNNNFNGSTKSTLVIDSAKTSSSIRIVPMCSLLLEKLKIMHQQSVSEFVISNDEKFVNPRTYDYRFHKILEDANISRINFHALRHTFATRCVEKGMDVKSLSEILGHGNTDITLGTYVHPSMAYKQQQIEMIC